MSAIIDALNSALGFAYDNILSIAMTVLLIALSRVVATATKEHFAKKDELSKID